MQRTLKSVPKFIGNQWENFSSYCKGSITTITSLHLKTACADLCQGTAVCDPLQRSLNTQRPPTIALVLSCTWCGVTFKKAGEWESLQAGRRGVEHTCACVCVLSSLQSRNAHRQAPAFMVQLKVKLITSADSPYPAAWFKLWPEALWLSTNKDSRAEE